MKNNQLHTARLPMVSLELAQDLHKRFPQIKIKPGMSPEEIQYNAGQRAVVEFIIAHATGTVMSGDPVDLPVQPRNKSLLNTLLGK